MFSALGTTTYSVLLASANLDLNNPPKNDPDYAHCFGENTAMNMSRFYSEIPKFENLTTQECINTHATDFITDRGTLILVTNKLTADNDSFRWVHSTNSMSLDHFSWMCAGLPDFPGSCKKVYLDNWSLPSRSWSVPLLNATIFSNTTYTIKSYDMQINPTLYVGYMVFDDGPRQHDPQIYLDADEFGDLSKLLDFMKDYPHEKDLRLYLDDASQWKNISWAKSIRIQKSGVKCNHINSGANNLENFPVDYCLSQRIDEKCQLLFSLPICLTVIFCNVIKVVCMFLTAHDDRKEIFLTVGDAISSFVDNPDKMTENSCLLSKSTIGEGPHPWRASLDNSGFSQESAALLPGKKRWMKAVGISNWAVTIALYVYLMLINSS